MPVALDKFVKQLEESGIVIGDTLKDFIPPRASPQNAEELARELIRQKLLTKFQAEEVSKGKGKSLTLGNYVLMEKIGQGGMGAVFKARHRRMDRIVAIKLLPPEMTKDSAAIARFEREVIAAAKISHPNIVAAHDADCANGVNFLVMEYVEGSDLSAMVKKNGPFSVTDALNYILQVVSGLEAAHAAGITHRDIKPANLLLDNKGTIKILDMGLARIQGESGPQAELTSTGAVMGTVDYMPPEQALSTKHADARSDIYSLGISFWYLLTAKSAYDGDTLMSKLLAHRDAPIPSLCAARPEVPSTVDVVFQKMVAKDPNHRHQSMTELTRDLEDCISGRASSASVKAPHPVKKAEIKTPVDVLNLERTKSMQGAPPRRTTATRTKKDSAVEATMLSDDLAELMTSPNQDMTGFSTNRPSRSGKKAQQSNWWKDHRVQIGSGLGVLLILSIACFLQFPTGTQRVATVSTADSNVQQSSVSTVASTIGWQGWPADAPPPAVAPFDATLAKKHQQDWADYLNVQVEFTNTLGMKFVLIPPGEFTMGSKPTEIDEAVKGHGDDGRWSEFIKSEVPQHKVILTQPIYLGAHEVTQKQFEAVMGMNNSYFTTEELKKSNIANLNIQQHPVERVSWNDADEFCAKLSQKESLKPLFLRQGEAVTSLEGTGYRLPSEAEWEFGCRAGTETKFWCGDTDVELPQVEWYRPNSGTRSHLVGELKSNPLGLFDVHGNVYEWVADWWEPTYYRQFAERPAVNPLGPLTAGSLRVYRGGDFYTLSCLCRSPDRHAAEPTPRQHIVGFRVALSVNTLIPSERKNEIASKSDDRLKNTMSSQEEAQIESPIDLLKLIDLKRDLCDGDWRIDNGAFISGPRIPSILNIPYNPPSDYQITVTASRIGSDDGPLGFGVTSGTQRGSVEIDWGQKRYSGFALIDGNNLDSQKLPLQDQPVLKDGVAVTITCTIRSTVAELSIDGRVIAKTSPTSTMSLWSGYAERKTAPLFISGWTSYRITKLELQPLASSRRQ